VSPGVASSIACWIVAQGATWTRQSFVVLLPLVAT
jgi:hypothetical protein